MRKVLAFAEVHYERSSYVLFYSCIVLLLFYLRFADLACSRPGYVLSKERS